MLNFSHKAVSQNFAPAGKEFSPGPLKPLLSERGGTGFSFPRLPFREDRLFGLWVLLFLCVPLLFNYFSFEKFETAKIVLWLIILSVSLWVFVRQKTNIKIYGALFWLLGVFLFFGLLSAIFSPGVPSAVFGSYPRFSNGLLFYLIWAITLLLLFFSLSGPKTRFLLKVLFFDAVLVSIVGIIQSVGIGFYGGAIEAMLNRSPSLLGNPNFSAMFVVCLLPIGLFLLLESKNFYARLYQAIGIFLMLWAALIFSSRGGWLGIIAFISVFSGLLLIAKLPKTVFIYLFGILAAAVLMWTVFSGVNRPGVLPATADFSEANVNLRLFVWDIARQEILNSPILGGGIGNFQVFFQKYRGSNLASDPHVFDDAHNLFLNQAASGGVPFALLFLSLCGLGFYKGFKKLLNKKRLLDAALLASLASWLVMAAFNPVSTPNFLLLAFLIAALLAGEGREITLKLKLAVKAAVGILAFLMFIWALCFAAGEMLFFRAYKEYYDNNFAPSQKHLNFATALNPFNSVYYAYAAGDKVFLGQDFSEVEADLAKMKKLEPNLGKSYVAASKIYFLIYSKTGEGKYLEKSIEQMKLAIAKDPFFTERYFRLAFYEARAGRLEEAVATLQIGISYNPRDFQAWLLLSKIYQLEEREKQMYYALEQAYKLRPDIEQIKLPWQMTKTGEYDFRELPINLVIETRNLD